MVVCRRRAIEMNLSDIFLSNSSSIQGFFQLELIVEHDSTGIPLPSGISLLLLGLVVLTRFRRAALPEV